MPFSSSDFAGPKDMDRLGKLPGAPGAAAGLRKMRQDLSWALARSPERGAGHGPGWRAMGPGHGKIAKRYCATGRIILAR